MLHAGKDVAYTYVFTGIIPALIIVIFAVTGNGVTVREPSKGIVSEAAYAALALILTQARNSLIDLMAV
jgi:hypothetical protein